MHDDELITIREACRLLGGNEKPIHFSTYYRGVARGLYPPLVHPSPGISRVSKRALIELRALNQAPRRSAALSRYRQPPFAKDFPGGHFGAAGAAGAGLGGAGAA